MTSVFNRRTALGLLGAGSAAFLAACAPLRSVKKSSGVIVFISIFGACEEL